MYTKKIRCNSEALLARRTIRKLENHIWTEFRDSLFNIFAPNFFIGSRSDIRKLRTRHAAIRGTYLPQSSSNHCGKATPPQPL